LVIAYHPYTIYMDGIWHLWVRLQGPFRIDGSVPGWFAARWGARTLLNGLANGDRKWPPTAQDESAGGVLLRAHRQTAHR
jgi:hypothetical protein